MTIKIKVEKDGIQIAEFELVDNEYVNFEVEKEHEPTIKAFMQDCTDVIGDPNEHCLGLH